MLSFMSYILITAFTFFLRTKPIEYLRKGFILFSSYTYLNNTYFIDSQLVILTQKNDTLQ